MLLNAQVKPAHTSGNLVASGFSIGNADVILTYLTKTIYSNPIRAVCQEIMSNARDAHREVGNHDRAITVQLPTELDPTWSCRDYGPGISPDRMENVFTKYGNSTKRGDNLQTGGFGIGCKTPFAYSDTFTIRTIAKEDGKNILRLYTAVKEGDTSPRLFCIGEGEETQEHTGTTISVAVKPQDFRDFATNTFTVTQFWSVRPEIKNPCGHTWEDTKWEYEEPTWKIGNGRSYYNEVHVCVDGIPYRINVNEFNYLNEKKDTKCLRNILGHNLVLYFGVGELSLSLNREQLQYDDRTKKAIVARLLEIQDWIETYVEDKVKAATNYWEACCLYNDLNNVFSITDIANNILWNGKKIIDDPLYGHPAVNFRKFFHRGGKLRSDREYSIRASKKNLIVYNDELTERVNMRKVRQLMDQHKDMTLFIIQPDLDASEVAKWKTACHWQDMQDSFKMLSSVVLPPIVRGPRAKATSYVRDGQVYNYATQYFDSITTIDRKTGEGIVIPTVRGKNLEVNLSTVREWHKLGMVDASVNIYLIPERFTVNLGKGFVNYKSHLKTKYNEYVASHAKAYDAIKNPTNNDGSYNERFNSQTKFINENRKDLVAGKFLAWFDASMEIEKKKRDTKINTDIQTIITMARYAGINLDESLGIATLASMRDGMPADALAVLDDIIPCDWRIESKLTPYLIKAINAILTDIG